MSPFDDVPPFRGDLSPKDAKSWLETLVRATGSFSDSGILRLLSTKFVEGSPASEWFEDLEDGAKTSWITFQRQFRTKWVAAPLAKAQGDIKWAEFCDHRLTYENVFTSDFSDPAASREIVAAWVNTHFELGVGTNREDSELRKKTEALLPAFIQAYIQVYFPALLETFQGYCNAIEDIPIDAYRFEWLRCQKSSRDGSLERRVGDISERVVDSILSTLGNTRIRPGVSSRRRDTNNDGSIAWEPSSPLTSVISGEDMTETSISQLSTPLAELRPLPEVVEDTICQDDVVSRHWRKPVSSLNTKDRLTVAEKAIDFMLMLKTVVFNNQASMMNSAVAIFDKLVNRKGRELDSKVQLPIDQHPHSLWYSMEMIYNYRAYKAPLKLYICREEWNKFIPADQKVLNPNLGFVCSSTSPLTASGSTVCDAGQGNFKPVEGAFYDFTGAPAYFEARSGKTILFMTLSSYLAHHTKDPRILQIAIQCAICIKTRMLDSATMLIKDCALDNNGNAKAAGTLSCYLTGIAVEGFSVLASVSGDLAWNRLAVDIAESAMRARDWHGDDGVLTVGTDDTPDINEDSKAFKGLLSRGLLVVYQRNSSDQALRTMIRRYINVQFNALRELASHGNSYGVDWRGPYVGPFPHAQVAALDTLVAAIGVNSS